MAGQYDDKTVAEWEAGGRKEPLRIIQERQRKAKAGEEYNANARKQAEAGETPLSSDPKIASGQTQGIIRGKQLYGMDAKEIGKETQSIVSRRRDRLNGRSPAATEMRNERNRGMRMARAKGASQDEQDQLGRQYAMDISGEAYRREGAALSEYQKLIGNIIGGTSSLELGFAGLEKASEVAPTDHSTGSTGGTVICTELHSKGYLSDYVYAKDINYGIRLRCNDPAVYVGYRILADPIVFLMKRSTIFTAMVAFFAVGWAKDMAGQKSTIGKIVNNIGTPVCRFLGKAGDLYAKIIHEEI